MSGRRQPQRIPPPIDHGSERIDAEPVLREYPGELGLALWKTVRSVRLWTELAPESRDAAFHPEAYERRMALLAEVVEDAELRGHLEAAAAVLKGSRAGAREVADACANTAEWAHRAQCTGTAIQFMQAASFASPTDVSFSYRTGRLAAVRAEHARAETWARHTLGLARRARDWNRFCLALLGLAAVHYARGNLPMARKLAQRVVRVGKRHSLREQVGYGYSALLGWSAGVKERDQDHYARAALAAFGPGHPWLPALAQNLATQWMDRGHFAAALTLFLRIPHDFNRPDSRLGIAANTARAAAGAGDLVSYREARGRAEALLDDPSAQHAAAVSLINLARAALLTGEWDYGQAMAERAVRLATELGQAQEVMSAEGLVQALAAERRAGAAPRPARPGSPPLVTQLAADLSAALETVGA